MPFPPPDKKRKVPTCITGQRCDPDCILNKSGRCLLSAITAPSPVAAAGPPVADSNPFSRSGEGESTPRELAEEALQHIRRAAEMVDVPPRVLRQQMRRAKKAITLPPLHNTKEP